MKAIEKKSLLLLFVLLACTTGLGFVHSKRTKSNLVAKTRTKRIRSIYVLGDSQVAQTLGEAYQQVYAEDEIWVDWFGKSGATPNDYVSDPTLFNDFNTAIKSVGCFDVIVIQLGDNGVQNSTSVSQLRSKLKDLCPTTMIVWSGPMKAVRPTNGSTTYVSTDPTSPRYLPTYNKTRELWNSRIIKGLTEQDFFINNIELQSNQTSGAFTDKRLGDGVHLTKDSAKALVDLQKPLIESFWESYDEVKS